MLSGNSNFKVKHIGFLFAMVFGFMIFSAVDASAQWYPQTNRDNRQDDRRDRQRERRDDYRRNDDRYGNNSGYYGTYGNAIAVARQEGYRDGLAAGRDDARDGERYKPQNHSDFKKATDGYQRSYGDKGQYRQAYRDAFVQGYNQGYRNNDRRGNGRWGNGGW